MAANLEVKLLSLKWEGHPSSMKSLRGPFVRKSNADPMEELHTVTETEALVCVRVNFEVFCHFLHIFA